MSQFQCPEFNDLPADVLQDFLDTLDDLVNDIQSCIATLDRDPENQDAIHQLFRAFHTLKGNCDMVLLTPFVALTHKLEEIISELRHAQAAYSPAYGKVFNAAINTIAELIHELAQHQTANSELLLQTSQFAEQIQASEGQARQHLMAKAIYALTGENISNASLDEAEPDPQRQKLEFFRFLANQLDEVTSYRQNRTAQVLDLALALNTQLDTAVDETQLTAAVYLHDIGMALIPSDIFSKSTPLTQREITRMRQHVYVGAGILQNMPGWEQAAQMVVEHHEHYNGDGYPTGKSGDALSIGAGLIAIADTFYALINARPDRSDKKSLISAVTVINSHSGSQFHPAYVQAFNQVIRRHYLGK